MSVPRVKFLGPPIGGDGRPLPLDRQGEIDWRAVRDPTLPRGKSCPPCPLLAGPTSPLVLPTCDSRYWPCHASGPGFPPSGGRERSHEVWRRAHWLMGECAGERTRGKWRKRKVRK